MNRLEIMFDYGYWRVELRNRHGEIHVIHKWLLLALWRAFTRQPQRESSK